MNKMMSKRKDVKYKECSMICYPRLNSGVINGEIDKKTFLALVDARGKLIDKKKKTDKKSSGELYFSGKGKLQDYNIKPYFRLHPPRKGIKSKVHYPKGVLGKNKEINELILRML